MTIVILSFFYEVKPNNGQEEHKSASIRSTPGRLEFAKVCYHHADFIIFFYAKHITQKLQDNFDQ